MIATRLPAPALQRPDAHSGAGAPRLPVLIVLHQPQSTPGHVGRQLRLLGYPLDIRRPRYGDPLPVTLAGHAGAAIFGGPMSANDPDDYIRQETEWIGVALDEGKPFLGVCLGAQMLARLIGGRVWLDPGGRVEIGYHRIAATHEARAIGLADLPGTVYQWHREGFDLPAGARLLAGSEGVFANQAFAYGENALAVQFHPEITFAMIHRWTTLAAHRLVLPGAQPRHAQLEDHHAHGPQVQSWLPRFLAGWLAGADRSHTVKAAIAKLPMPN